MYLYQSGVTRIMCFSVTRVTILKVPQLFSMMLFGNSSNVNICSIYGKK